MRPNRAVIEGLKQLGAFGLVFVCVYLAQFYKFLGREESLLWFPAGAGLGLAVRFGYRILPALAMGALGAYLTLTRYPIDVSVWTTSTWIASLAAAVALLRRFGPSDMIGAPLRSLLLFYAFGVVVAPLIHTALDYPILLHHGLIDRSQDLRVYVFLYWFGEALGALVLGPALYLLGRDFSARYTGPEALFPESIHREKIIWLLLAALVAGLTLEAGRSFLYAGVLDMELLLYPMLVWSALRLGVVFTNLATLLVGLFVLTCYAFGAGGTPPPSTTHDVIALALFLVSLSLMAQLLAAAVLERRLQAGEALRAANLDWITGLANFQGFKHRVKAQRKRDPEPEHAFGLIVLDVHDTLLDAYGLEARNALLAQFGKAIASRVGSDVSVARIASGSFALLFPGIASDIARQRLETLAAELDDFAFLWDGRRFRVKPRFAVLHAATGAHDELISRAASLRGLVPAPDRRVVVLSPLQGQQARERRSAVETLSEIQEALRRDRFRLFMEPIVALQEQASAGRRFEVLLRMLDRDGQLVAPGLFVPVAEQHDLMPAIDGWVLRHTLQWLTGGRVALAEVASCSVNLSGRSVDDREFRDLLVRAVADGGLPAGKLTFEVTETVAVHNLEQVRSFLELLKTLGCRLALDDFGTGMSSFEYLKALPVDEIKIGGVFVRDLHRDPLDRAIVRAVLEVARAAGIQTVAEFVEDESTLRVLREMGVDFAQGSHVGRPVPLEDL